jgi:hypothetical protein
MEQLPVKNTFIQYDKPLPRISRPSTDPGHSSVLTDGSNFPDCRSQDSLQESDVFPAPQIPSPGATGIPLSVSAFAFPFLARSFMWKYHTSGATSPSVESGLCNLHIAENPNSGTATPSHSSEHEVVEHEIDTVLQQHFEKQVLNELINRSKTNKRQAAPTDPDPSAPSNSTATTATNCIVSDAEAISPREFEEILAISNTMLKDAITALDAESQEVILYNKASDTFDGMEYFIQVWNPSSGICCDGARLEKKNSKWRIASGKKPAQQVKKAISDHVDYVKFKSSNAVVMGRTGKELRSFLGQLRHALEWLESGKANRKVGSVFTPHKSYPCFKEAGMMLQGILDSNEGNARHDLWYKIREWWTSANVFCTHDLVLMIEKCSEGQYSEGGTTCSIVDLALLLKQHSQSLWDSEGFQDPGNELTTSVQKKVRIRLIWATLRSSRDYTGKFLREAEFDLNDWLKLGKNKKQDAVDYDSTKELLEAAIRRRPPGLPAPTDPLLEKHTFICGYDELPPRDEMKRVATN